MATNFQVIAKAEYFQRFDFKIKCKIIDDLLLIFVA